MNKRKVAPILTGVEWVVNAPQKGRGVIDFAPFKTRREKKCELCGYSNRVVIHHIVGLDGGGDHCEENTLIVCPNHHAELHLGKIKAPKNGKVCEAYSKLPEFAKLWQYVNSKMKYNEQISDAEINQLKDYKEKYGFDKDHALAYMAGCTRKVFKDTYK